MLRFSANLGFLWTDLPLLDGIRSAAAAGFDAVEFHFPYDVPAEAVRQALGEAGLPATGLNTRRGDTQAGDFGLAALPGRESEARAAIDEAIGYARAIGADYVHVMAGKPGGDAREAARRAYLDALDHAAALAEAGGITIVIEPLNQRDAPGYFLNANVQAADIIAELGRENLKLLFDCYHAQVSEGDLTRQIEKLLPIIGHIQIAAVPSRAEPDEGEVAYERLLKTIEAMGYAGFIGAEYRPRGHVEDGLDWLGRCRDALSR
ncbi:MAG: TIM barrel protein [Rhizobiales bacterium]|nr:TIM barrel protein [Hyphomicrobiales bacterium]MDQ3559928.1 TIM barrel protein [Pseudomonadota bacterium]